MNGQEDPTDESDRQPPEAGDVGGYQDRHHLEPEDRSLDSGEERHGERRLRESVLRQPLGGCLGSQTSAPEPTRVEMMLVAPIAIAVPNSARKAKSAPRS